MLTQRPTGMHVRKAGLSPAAIPYAGMDRLHTLPLIQLSKQHHGIDTSDPILQMSKQKFQEVTWPA